MLKLNEGSLSNLRKMKALSLGFRNEFTRLMHVALDISLDIYHPWKKLLILKIKCNV